MGRPMLITNTLCSNGRVSEWKTWATAANSLGESPGARAGGPLKNELGALRGTAKEKPRFSTGFVAYHRLTDQEVWGSSP